MQLKAIHIIMIHIIMLLALASPASAQLLYDEVKIEVAPGVACPSAWSASTESITTEDRYIVQAPVSLGGRAFYVTSRLVDLLWPGAADKVTATTTGLLVIEVGRTVEVNFCALLP